MKVGLHEIKHDTDVSKVERAPARGQQLADMYDVFMLEVLQDFNFTIGALRENEIVEYVRDLFDSDSFAVAEVDRRADDAVGSAAYVVTDAVVGAGEL